MTFPGAKARTIRHNTMTFIPITPEISRTFPYLPGRSPYRQGITDTSGPDRLPRTVRPPVTRHTPEGSRRRHGHALPSTNTESATAYKPEAVPTPVPAQPPTTAEGLPTGISVAGRRCSATICEISATRTDALRTMAFLQRGHAVTIVSAPVASSSDVIDRPIVAC